MASSDRYWADVDIKNLKLMQASLHFMFGDSIIVQVVRVKPLGGESSWKLHRTFDGTNKGASTDGPRKRRKKLNIDKEGNKVDITHVERLGSRDEAP